MGILGSLFGVSDEASTDFGSRLALAGQVLMAMDQGQVANIGPSVAALNERRRKIADEMQSKKWLQNQAAMMADKNPQLARLLEGAPPEVGASLISKYLETLPEFRAPDWKTFESQGDIYRYNPLDPTSKPELFFDGPDDPFKQLLKSVMPPTPGTAAPSAAPGVPAAGMPAPGVPEMPAPGGAPATSLAPQLQMIADVFGIPDATAEEVQAIARAGSLGIEQARATANAIREQRAERNKMTDDMREYGMAVQQGYRGTFQDYQIEMKKAGASQVNVNGGGTDKQIFDETKARADAARAANVGLSAINTAQEALPGAITGAAANERLGLQKVAALFGVGDTSAIADTETFRSAIAPQVAAMMKATVGSTQISNADREFAEKAAGGSITLDAQSIQRLLNIMRAANSEIVRGFNKSLDKVYPDGQGFERERALFDVPNASKFYSAPIGPEMPEQTVDPANPQPGDTVLGYRFKGGDRRDPNNWEKVE